MRNLLLLTLVPQNVYTNFAFLLFYVFELGAVADLGPFGRTGPHKKESPQARERRTFYGLWAYVWRVATFKVQLMQRDIVNIVIHHKW